MKTETKTEEEEIIETMKSMGKRLNLNDGIAAMAMLESFKEHYGELSGWAKIPIIGRLWFDSYFMKLSIFLNGWREHKKFMEKWVKK